MQSELEELGQIPEAIFRCDCERERWLVRVYESGEFDLAPKAQAGVYLCIAPDGSQQTSVESGSCIRARCRLRRWLGFRE